MTITGFLLLVVFLVVGAGVILYNFAPELYASLVGPIKLKIDAGLRKILGRG